MEGHITYEEGHGRKDTSHTRKEIEGRTDHIRGRTYTIIFPAEIHRNRFLEFSINPNNVADNVFYLTFFPNNNIIFNSSTKINLLLLLSHLITHPIQNFTQTQKCVLYQKKKQL